MITRGVLLGSFFLVLLSPTIIVLLEVNDNSDHKSTKVNDGHKPSNGKDQQEKSDNERSSKG